MKKKYVILGSVLVIGAIVVGSTLAWFTWSTTNDQNTNVVVTVGGATISYEDGENITNNNLIPTSTKEKGISKDITISSTSTVYLDLNMTVVTLDEGLKDASFKYGLYDDTDSPVVEGNFASSNANDEINLLDGVQITSSPVTYTLYIWIDGNMSNPSTMYNQNFEFRLNANATDEVQNVITTRTSDEMLSYLGLSSNGEMSSVTAAATTDEGIYETTDDYGTTYFYRGAATNNYVQFAGYYWRIVRINGDGSIRMVYDGTSAHANGESSTDRQISTSAFNPAEDDNAYVGYMYGQTEASSYSATHANTNNSTIKIVVDNWYKTNIEDKGYSQYIADVIYCNDRQIAADSASYLPSSVNFGVLGYEKNSTIYGPLSRYESYTFDPKPIQEIKMICSQQNDAFTVRGIEKGNGILTYPVGLLTVDELFAGGFFDSYTSDINSNCYLYTGQDYWTMSPGYFDGSYDCTIVIYASSSGRIGSNTVFSSTYGVRPVLSLKSSVELSGNGTIDSPYQVQIN